MQRSVRASKLIGSDTLDFNAAVSLARKHRIPTIIDGAAQDFRVTELLQTGADLVLISAQKYLAAPTAGLVVGKKHLVEAVRAQEKGIGRGMKASKEAIAGVLAAIQFREALDLEEWREAQQLKVYHFVARCNDLRGISARAEPDPTGLPFSRAYLHINAEITQYDAKTMASQLKAGEPSIWLIDQQVDEGELGFELVQLCSKELDIILDRLAG